ncbi:MAG: radical SAM protein [Planctomycetes bacterium]|nr:radical SAM protein [Planctomycetota bacterium]
MRASDWLKIAPTYLKHLGKLPLKHMLYMTKRLKYENPHLHNGQIRINTFFPPIPSPSFERFFENLIERKRVPCSTYIAVTENCPYKCPHCSYGSHVSGELDTEQTLDIIKQLKDLGTVIIGFTGGEPLLRKDIVQLVEAANDEASSVLFTTGFNLDENLCKKFADAHLGCLTIGIESQNADIHDEVRGSKGSFEQAVKSIKMSLDAGLYTAISTVGTREKFVDGTLEQLAILATENGVHEFRILEPIPTGSMQGQDDEILTPQESKQLADFHKNWNAKRKGPAVACFAYLESDEMFGCGAGFHHLYIDAAGNVCPCDLTPLSFGNVTQQPLTEIWKKMGESFDRPRQGCFMKEICNKINCGEENVELPLTVEQSVKLCCSDKKQTPLPKIYENIYTKEPK